MQFIYQSLPKVLPDGRRSASDPDILSVGGIASPFKCGANPVSNEMKGRASLHYEWRTGMIREHENLRMVNRVLTPPSPPALIRPGTAHWPEHISAHDPGANIAEAARGKVVVNPGLSVFASEQLRLKRAGGERPFMKGRSAGSQRVFQALIRACAKAVNRNGVAFYAEFSHLVVPSVAVFWPARSGSPGWYSAIGSPGCVPGRFQGGLVLAWIYESGLANFCQKLFSQKKS
jgi:hypothetical protein